MSGVVGFCWKARVVVVRRVMAHVVRRWEKILFMRVMADSGVVMRRGLINSRIYP